MKTGFKLILMTLPIVAMGVGFVGYTIATKPDPAQDVVSERAVAVRVITARRASVSATASGFGLITPARSYQAVTQVNGTVEFMNQNLKKGEILPEGAVLVRLSDRDYRLAAAQAQANIRATEARMAEIAVSESNLEAGLAIEQETLGLKELEWQRLVKLTEVGSSPQSSVDSARVAYLAQSQKVQNLQNSLALLPTQRQVQLEQITVYRTTLATAELNIDRTELRLPFAARVGDVSIEIGQFVRSGQVLAAFDGIEAAEVEAQISAADLTPIFSRIGGDDTTPSANSATLTNTLATTNISASIVLQLGQTPVEWSAKVDRISNTIDPKTGTLGVILRIDNAYASAEPGVRPPLTRGMFVEARLKAPPISAIVVPRSALRSGQVMLADADNRLRLAPVEVGFYLGRFAILTAGLEDGDTVVVSAPVPMVDGVLLTLHPDEALMQDIAKSSAAQ